MNGLLNTKIKRNMDLFLEKEDFISSMKHFSIWNNIELNRINQSLKYDKIKIENKAFNFIVEDTNDILQETLIFSHKVVNNNLTKKEIEEALLFLKKLDINYYNLVSNFIINIWNVEIKDKYKENESQLTSCTFPSMPFSIFLSEKALFHIPPKNIYKNNSIVLLAENIYHEAIHSAINYQILYDDIFIEEYDSKKSEKIDIPWRKNQIEERNKYWEIDRVYHAAIVYRNVIDFRKKIISSSDISDELKEFVKGSFISAIDSYNYLLKELKNKEKYFLKNGLKSLRELEYENNK